SPSPICLLRSVLQTKGLPLRQSARLPVPKQLTRQPQAPEPMARVPTSILLALLTLLCRAAVPHRRAVTFSLPRRIQPPPTRSIWRLPRLRWPAVSQRRVRGISLLMPLALLLTQRQVRRQCPPTTVRP